MICNRKAFVRATGCPQISVDISFPDLSYCDDPEYINPKLCDACDPNMLPQPDINFPGGRKCFSILITLFSGVFTHVSKENGPFARFHVINTQASGACNESGIIGIRPEWGCPLMSKFPKNIPLMNVNEWTAGPFGELRVTISTFCSVEINGNVDLRLILPKWERLDADGVCANDGYIVLNGGIVASDPGIRFTVTKAKDETCKYVTRKLTYILKRFSSTNIQVTKFYKLKKMTCFVENERARCSLAEFKITRIFNVVRFITKDTITHTFMATGFWCEKGPCCTIEKTTIVAGQRVVSQGTYKNDILVFSDPMTLHITIPMCHTKLSTATGDQFYGFVTLRRHKCGIDGDIRIRDYGNYRPMRLHKLSLDDVILSVKFGENMVSVTPRSTTPCDILPPRVVMQVKPAKLFEVLGHGDIGFEAVGDYTYEVIGPQDLTVYYPKTGPIGPVGTIGLTGETGLPGAWFEPLCECKHKGECLYDECPHPCEVYPAVCMYYYGAKDIRNLPGHILDMHVDGHDLIIVRESYSYTVRFANNAPNVVKRVRMATMVIHGCGYL